MHRFIYIFLLEYPIVIGLASLVFVVSHFSEPFHKQFMVSDTRIRYPFVVKEHVPPIVCGLLALVLPTIIMVVIVWKRLERTLPDKQGSFLAVCSVLSLMLSISLSGAVSGILKIWIGGLRPDFLARCGPKYATPSTFADITICTAPYGATVLREGMRSTPSGHACAAFSGLVVFSLWLYGQFGLLRKRLPLHKHVLALLPLFLAIYIAITRIQDHRHHFTDVFLGAFFGSSFAVPVYHRFFPPIWSCDSDKPYKADELSVMLPI